MSKSKHNKYNDRRLDREYMDGEVDYRKMMPKKNKRIERALRTMDVEELTVEEGIDPDDYANWLDEELLEMQHANV